MPYNSNNGGGGGPWGGGGGGNRGGSGGDGSGNDPREPRRPSGPGRGDGGQTIPEIDDIVRKGQEQLRVLMGGRGGGTGFPKLEVEVAAKPGRMCIFHDLIGDGPERHPKALHAGLPVKAGEKWACNLWFRERPYPR